jgi:hypothetical protein
VVMWFPNALIAVLGLSLLVRGTIYPAPLTSLFARRPAAARGALQG